MLVQGGKMSDGKVQNHNARARINSGYLANQQSAWRNPSLLILRVGPRATHLTDSAPGTPEGGQDQDKDQGKQISHQGS